jgi:DNA-directed RNA polymerase specialized sigma24 family protein
MAYRDGQTIKEVAVGYGIHRTTVTALLSRQGVKLRRTGLTSEEIPEVALLYKEGWSLARLGARFDVNAATVWRALREAGIAMRSPNERHS